MRTTGREASLAESSREPRSWRPLRRASLILIGALTLGAPLVVGGVFPEVFVASALVGGVALWLALVGRRDRVPLPAAGWALLGGGLMALICVLPLPAALVGKLSPQALALAALPGEDAPARVALSLDVPATILAAARLFGLATVLLASACLAVRPEQARWLGRLVALAGIAVALVSAGHLALGMNEIYGVIPFRFESRAFTVFIDPNHAASLGILSTLACLGLSVGRTDPLDRWAWWLGAALCTVMAISTQSVAGLSMLAAALGLFVVLQLRRKLGLTGGAAWVQPLVGGVAVAFVLLVLLAVGVLVTDSVEFVQTKALGKMAPWLTVLKMVKDFSWTGVGAGAFNSSFEAYMPPAHLNTVTHPENFVLQWIAEWGVPAGILAIVAILLTFWKALRSPAEAEDRLGGVHDALLAATIGVLLHDLADFGLEFQGVGIPFVVALGVLVARSGRPKAARWAAAVVALAAVSVAVFAARAGLPRQRYVQEAQAKIDVFGKKPDRIAAIYRDLIRLHPADPYLQIHGARALAVSATGPMSKAERKRALQQASVLLERAMARTQNDGPYITLAWVLSQQGKRKEAVAAVRQAFRRGREWDDVTRFAHSMGFTPKEMASLPVALSDIPLNPKDKIDIMSASTMAVLGELSSPAERRLVAEALLDHVEAGKLPRTPIILGETCRALSNDAFCSRTVTYGCDLPGDADAISARTLRLGSDWLHRDPTQAGAYMCTAQAYWSFGAAEERARTLAVGAARIPDDLQLRASFALALVDSGQPAEALETIKDLVPELLPSQSTDIVYQTRARAYWAMGKRGKALRQVDDAVRLNPESFWAYTLAIRYHEFAHQYDQALSLLEVGRRFCPPAFDAKLNDWRSQIREEKAEEDSSNEKIENTLARDSNTPDRGFSGSTARYGRWSGARFIDIQVQLMRINSLSP